MQVEDQVEAATQIMQMVRALTDDWDERQVLIASLVRQLTFMEPSVQGHIVTLDDVQIAARKKVGRPLRSEELVRLMSSSMWKHVESAIASALKTRLEWLVGQIADGHDA